MESGRRSDGLDRRKDAFYLQKREGVAGGGSAGATLWSKGIGGSGKRKGRKWGGTLALSVLSARVVDALSMSDAQRGCLTNLGSLGKRGENRDMRSVVTGVRGSLETQPGTCPKANEGENPGWG
jgi:hypothetical protein